MYTFESTTETFDPTTTTTTRVVNTTHHVLTALQQGGPTFGLVLKVVYLTGILGNAAAIIAVRRGERRVRNRKHLLLLTSLATNDLVALLGMMCAMLVSEYLPHVQHTRGYCAARVALRVFGIGSVCIAVTMALERYLALTRPFFYQKQVTYYVIRWGLVGSWLFAAVLTCAPVAGLGLYYNEPLRLCLRYRTATEGLDYAYAVFYVAFGTLLCAVLVYCNLAVICALYAISAPTAGQTVVRRVSRKSCRNDRQTHNAATAEEVAFSRLMAALSVLFMICWLPQMVTSAVFLSPLRPGWLPAAGLGSDLLMLLNYVLDPVLYVLLRHRPRRPATACHMLLHCFKKHKSSRDSKGSCCMQETVVVSDSSGSELRPLAPAVCGQLLTRD